MAPATPHATQKFTIFNYRKPNFQCANEQELGDEGMNLKEKQDSDEARREKNESWNGRKTS